MPIKDALRIFTCKYCGQQYKMFKDPKRGLIFFPENFPWPIHGEFELTDHIRREHREQHETAMIFYGSLTEEVKRSYAIS